MGRLVVAAAAPIAPILPAGAGAVLAGGQGGGGVLMRGSVSSVLINSPRQARALIQAGAGPRALIIPTRQPMPSIVAAGSRGVPGISAVVETSPAFTYTAGRVTRIDYASFIDSETLEEVDRVDERTVLALAVHIDDRVRLIDNGFVLPRPTL